MANGNTELLRKIAVMATLLYDKSGVSELMRDTDKGVAKLLELAATYNIVSKAAKAYDQREIASETARVRLEAQKLTVVNKKLGIANKEASLLNKDLSKSSKEQSIANQKQALVNKQLAAEDKKVATAKKEVQLASAKLRLEAQKDKSAQLAQGYKKQSSAARTLITDLDGVKQSLIGIGIVAAGQGLLQIAGRIEQAGFRISNFIDERQFAALEKRFEQLNKQSKKLFSKTDFEESAAAVFVIDRNTRRFARTLEFAILKAPVLGKTMKQIQVGLAEDIVGGGTSALEELGLVTQLELENMRRRTGLSFGDLRLAEREKFVFDRLRLTPAALFQSNKAAKGLNATWGRFLTVVSESIRLLQEDFKPVAIFILSKITKFLDLLLSSPVALFALRIGGLIAGLAALAIGIGALTKALAFLRVMLLATNTATLLLWGKLLLIGSIVIGLIILVDDFWLSLNNPEADTVFNSLLNKHPALRELFTDLITWSKALSMHMKVFYPKELGLTFQLTGILDLIIKIGRGLNWLKPYIDTLLTPFSKLKEFIESDEESAFVKFLRQPIVKSVGSLFEDNDGEVESLLGLLRGGLAPIGLNLNAGINLQNQDLQRLNPVNTQSDNITYITVGGNTIELQSGVDRNEILQISTDNFKLELEKQLIEADIGGR